MNLTWLYAPAHSIHAAKALDGPAHIAVLDLEDSVAPESKQVARQSATKLLLERPKRPASVRVNAAGTPWLPADLQALRDLPGGVSVRVPKVSRSDDVELVSRSLPGRPIHALIETCEGLENLPSICRALPPGSSIGLGEADLMSDMGTRAVEALTWARVRLVAAAAAHGLPPPAMSVYTDLGNEDGLRQHCRHGKRLGFVGQAAIHPRQLPIILQEYSPAPSEVEHARTVLAALEGARRHGSNTVVLADGNFLDPAMLKLAKRTIAVHEVTREARNS